LIEQVDAIIIAGRARLRTCIVIDLIALDMGDLIGVKPAFAILLKTVNEDVAWFYGLECAFVTELIPQPARKRNEINSDK
jgi:hypothetical protein